MENILCAILVIIVILLVWKTYYPTSYPFNVTIIRGWGPNKDARTYDAKLSQKIASKDRKDENESLSNRMKYGYGTNLQYNPGVDRAISYLA